MDRVVMKIRPIQRTYGAFDRDERHDAEKRFFRLLLQLLEQMNIPTTLVPWLQGEDTRHTGLQWIESNLEKNNSDHPDLQRVRNIVAAMQRIERRKAT